MSNICVFCGSSSGTDPAFRAAAVELGAAIAASDHGLVYGGGGVGLMGVVADAVLDAGGEVTGVITEQLLALEVGHVNLTNLEVLPDMHTRKARMAELSGGVVVLPGGFGTYEEAFEVLTWNQLGIVAAPIVFLDVDVNGQSFFASLFDFIDGAVAAGFMKPEHGDLAQRATDPIEAVAIAAGPAPSFTRKWVG
ncbi:TIGR00730 family Rossman fold protein [uncultured Ilumatobacter sp.]|uniref:LOG family protein n=1 Tax=uncultured Ilumatobacter sp. TaxID=879968 RepID=UPI00374E66F1